MTTMTTVQRPSKVQFHGISTNFGSVDVLNDISIDVAEGEFLCIVGPSGCGKSTLLNIAGGFLRPSSGEVTIDGSSSSRSAASSPGSPSRTTSASACTTSRRKSGANGSSTM